MSAVPRPSPLIASRAVEDWFVHDLLKLQKAAQTINSTLDLDQLLDRIVNEVAVSFGCIETGIWLIDEHKPDYIHLASIRGCTENEKGCCLLIGKEGMIGYVAATGLTRYAPDVSRDPFYQACEPGTNSELDIPLLVGNKVIGVFSAVHHQVDAFPPDQRRLLEALCGHIAVAVQNARAFRREREQRERIERDAREARVIQESLLPQSSPYLPGFVFEATSVPAGEVGGDWYDYIDLGSNRWGVVMADVSGKGMAAALLMSATRGILRSLARTHSDPAELLGKLNCVLQDDFPAGRFVTMIYGVLDANQRTFTFANAGHPYPVFVHKDDAVLIDGESGLPLGIRETIYQNHTVQLKQGIKLLLYSDGISEAENHSGEEFGSRRIREHMLGEESSAASLLKAVREHSGHHAPADDATVILLRCSSDERYC